jgi:aryl-alcohol dehydrogenase-like predicted oxidoreductase
VVQIGNSGIDISRVVLGGNVFGWTADEESSFAILDAYLDGGGNSVDLADSYPHWAQGCRGGESEQIVGRWMADRGNRDAVVVATKVGKFPGNYGLSREQINAGLRGSLERLQTEYVDLYYCHLDDPQTPLEETLEALAEQIEAGRIRAIAASNYSTERLAAALATSDRLGLPRFVAVQPQYSLVVRDEFEGSLQQLCEREGLSCLPFWPLAAGFLTGKYTTSDIGDSPRGRHVAQFFTERNWQVLAVVRDIAVSHGVEPTTVALAWLLTRPTVAAPVASVSRMSQLPALMQSMTLELTVDELAELDEVSAPRSASS